MTAPRHVGLSLLIALIALPLAGCRHRADSSSEAEASPPQQAATDDVVTLMRSAMAIGDWQQADQYTADVLITRPDDPALLVDVARVVAQNGRKREAADLMIEACEADQYELKSRVKFTVQALIIVGELYKAIDVLEASLAAHPDRDDQRRILVGFLAEAQQTHRIPEHLQVLIEHRAFDLQLLQAVTETSSRRLSESTAERLIKLNPEDQRIRLSDAYIHMHRRDAVAAGKVLREVLDHHPNFAAAYAMYGQALATQELWSELGQWWSQTPDGVAEYADYWLTLGDLAMHENHPAEAARAYWEATRRDANNVAAWDRLSRTMQSLRIADSQLATAVTQSQVEATTQRVRRLFDYRHHFNHFAANDSKSQRLATEVARALMKLGRNWEAEAWSAIAATLTSDSAGDLPALRHTIIDRIQHDRNWTSAKYAPAIAIDLSNLPLPKRSAAGPQDRHLARVIPNRDSIDHLLLREEADQWGLHSVGAGNNPAEYKVASLMRFTGVGGGAVDYDLDGNVDIVVMGAGGTLLQADSLPNVLMRNLGERFVAVGDAAAVNDRRFGQGVAVGDFNDDGFPDLFCTNIDRNQLLRNNGDGTFTDCSDLIDHSDQQKWTTSAAFLDADGDALTDLITCCYSITEPQIAEPCRNEAGQLQQCHPLRFPGEADRFYRGTPDAHLTDVSNRWTTSASRGRGLGVVAGLMDKQNMGIFITNDMTANAFYSRSTAPEKPLIESAGARGLAVDGRSLSQASMGIASSDLDLDGDLDFYVTGFAREYNILYSQESPGVWRDVSGGLGLIEPTLRYVGFGTEAIDLDDDGIDELIVTNGDIGQFNDPQREPYEQPLQIFRRGSQGRFQWIDDDAWGDYFSTPHVGRALWTMDVNRDGRNDVMITHMYEQVGLLVNRGQDVNRRIAFKLVSTQASRDAVGAVVQFQDGRSSRSLWMLSGDGYMCSNERSLRAGLGQSQQADNVTVTWPDGSVESFGSLAADAEYLLVQGHGQAFLRDQFADAQPAAAR